MRYKLKKAEYEKVERLVDCALAAPNKAEARPYIQQLNYVCNDLFGAANNILHELIAATDTASGNVRDKEKLEYFAQMSLHKLAGFVENNEPNN